MAYAAVISLKQTIHRLLNYSPQILILPPCQVILKSAYEGVRSLQKILERLQISIGDSSISNSGRAVHALSEEIRDVVCKIEDLLESHVSNQFLISESDEISLGDDDLEELVPMQDLINSFKETAKVIDGEYNFMKQELESSNPTLPEEDDDVDFGGKKSTNMVGLSDEFNKIKDLLIKGRPSENCETVTVVGMAGIGKTTLARKIFEDPSVRSCFQRCAFVTVGQKYQIEKIKRAILAQMEQVNHDISSSWTVMESGFLHYLRNVKFLIVLDDVWDTLSWGQLGLYDSDGKNGSRVLLTTRLEVVARTVVTWPSNVHRMRFLNKEESLYLLREKVFGVDRLFPDPQLQKAAEKIAETCEGLPLAIIAVTDLLSKAERTPEYWKKVADKGSLIFLQVGEDMFEVLISSYNYLPQYLKPCFLYTGVFPPKSEIPASKLIKLWGAEGLLEPNPFYYIHNFARNLKDLASNSLILVREQSSRFGVKTCRLHPVYWALCHREAGKEKFFHVVNSYSDRPTRDIGKQRRLCIYKNVLFCIKELFDSMESNISMVRSLLCTGPNHKYPLPIFFQWKFLKVVDALTIRFYNFPVEVLELVHLRYLALIYSGQIPASISKLWNLQYLIVHRHVSIVSSGARTYLPIEIWNMRQLRCLQVMGSELPYHAAALSLLNLLTLSYMSADSCTKEILEKTPNLKKLGIQIELPPDIAAADHPLRCFDHLAHLCELESLKCVVVNPNPTSQVVFLAPSTKNFPRILKRLSLSGLGYPWDYMRIIARLPNLQVLKLRCYAFRGPKWEAYEYRFLHLKCLLLDDIDLESWGADDSCFPRLERLIIRHCYNLREFPVDSLKYGLKTLDVVDCPLALASVKEMQEEYAKSSGEDLQVCVKSSWGDKRPKS